MAKTTPETTMADRIAIVNPATTHNPSRSRIPNAIKLIANAGSILPRGIGSISIAASSRQTNPIAYSIGGSASPLKRGRNRLSARASQGPICLASLWKSSRDIDRLVIIAGNHGLRPKVSWTARKIKGAPSTADVPGGVGSMLGKANMNNNAPMARSFKAANRSPMEIRSRLWSSASVRKTSDSASPLGAFLTP